MALLEGGVIKKALLPEVIYQPLIIPPTASCLSNDIHQRQLLVHSPWSLMPGEARIWDQEFVIPAYLFSIDLNSQTMPSAIPAVAESQW